MYEKGTKRPVTLVENTEAVLITASSRDIVFGVSETADFNPLDPATKESIVKRGSDRYAKILKAGDRLYTSVAIGGKAHLAHAELLEDLYLFHKNSWKSEEAKMFACACRIIKVDGIN